jgi:hypothetical protein
MSISNVQPFDLHKRLQQKQSQRNQDVADLESKRFSRIELQRRNSMFSGIDWSEVEICEPGGYSWQAKPPVTRKNIPQSSPVQ